MSTQTLTINYSAPSALIDPYWIRIEQDVISDVATVDQTAKTLDALFQIDACNPAEEPTTTEPVEEDEAAESVADVLDLPACDAEPDGSVETAIHIYRSHLDEPYVLRLQGGTVVKTVQESGPVSVAVEIAETVTLDYPVVSGFSCTPAPLSRMGNTLRFAAGLVGFIKASYQSRWDLVTVKIHGVDGETGECRALAFHHGIADALDLDTPEIAELDRALCPTTRWIIDTDYEVTCYKDVLITQRCTCSGNKVGDRTEQQTVPCPNPDMRCPNNETRCMHLLGTETVTEWVECGGDAEIPGMPGRSYALSTPEFYREMCCKEPDVTLPQCPVKRTTYKAELPIERGQAFWRGLYGEATRFVPVAPAGGICGEWIVEQSLTSGCCIEIPEPVWDWDDSVQVLADNSDGWVSWSDSQPPYTVEVAGQGFWTDRRRTSKKAERTTPNLVLYTSNACGSGRITVTDACGHTVTGTVRSANGRWATLEANSCTPYPGYPSSAAARVGAGDYDILAGDMWVRYRAQVYCTIYQYCACIWIGPAEEFHGIMKTECELTKPGAWFSPSPLFCAVPAWGHAAIDGFLVFARRWVC